MSNPSAFARRLRRYYAWYTGTFLLFVVGVLGAFFFFGGLIWAGLIWALVSR